VPEQEIQSLVGQAVERVLETMCFSAVLGPFESSEAQPRLELAAGVEFTGASSGSVLIGCSPAGARALAASFLGEAEVSGQQVEEFVAELANMVCGAIVSNLDGAGQYALAPPRALSPAALTASAGVRCDFEIEEGVLSVLAQHGESPEAGGL
jgi:CheY-specific phosphatase CheX